MLSLRPLALLLASGVLLTACIAHEKSGDSAAAVGNWKGAVASYRAALAEDPNDAELQGKYANAKREAASGAWRKAQSCAAANEWQCAMVEADYALSIDEGNTEFATFRANAARTYAFEVLKSARDAGTRGDFASAFQLHNKGMGLSRDQAVQSEAAAVRGQLLSSAQLEAERLQKARQLREAVDLWTLIAQADASKNTQLEAARRELDAQLEFEYEQHAKRGDAALAKLRWAEAEGHYRAALDVKPGGRAEGLASYAGSVGRGEAGMMARDFHAATAGYRDAVATGLDATGYANQQLQLVEVKPYAVRIRSVLVKPQRPNGQPWAGAPTALFWTATKLLSAYIPKVVGDVISAAAIDAAQTVPPENRPTLHVQVTLPDGTKLRTADKKAVYTPFDGEFVVHGNVFDERRIVVQVKSSNDELGLMEVLVKDLVANGELTLAGQSVIALQLGTGAANGRAESSYAGLTPVGAPAVHGAGAVVTPTAP